MAVSPGQKHVGPSVIPSVLQETAFIFLLESTTDFFNLFSAKFGEGQ